jgi:hypothetical protein
VDSFHCFPFSIKRVSYNDIHNLKLFIITFMTISLFLLILTLQQFIYYLFSFWNYDFSEKLYGLDKIVVKIFSALLIFLSSLQLLN